MTAVSPLATDVRTLRYMALVPAAGTGARMTGQHNALAGPPKQYFPLAGKPMLWHAISTLCSVSAIERVYVVLSAEDSWWPAEEFAELGGALTVLRCGGQTRAQSVANGLRAMRSENSQFDEQTRVLVHDAARPCLTVAQVARLIREVGAAESGGLLAVPVADTLKRAGQTELPHVAATVPREGLWQAQTPQMFPWRLLLDALDGAPDVTDESSAVEALGRHPRLVESDSTNFKVTYPRDLELAERILLERFNLSVSSKEI